jgi:hypothetical protein
MRGKIYNRTRAKQIRDFSGLRFGTITPTDVDGLLDFQNTLFVLIESKYKEAPLPRGQRLALERVCDAIQKAGKMCAVLIIAHETEPSRDIDFACCPVVEWRYKGCWRSPEQTITCRAAIEKLLEKCGLVL